MVVSDVWIRRGIRLSRTVNPLLTANFSELVLEGYWVDSIETKTRIHQKLLEKLIPGIDTPWNPMFRELS